MSPQPVSSSEAQARLLAGELDRWVDQIEAELSGRVALPPSVQHAKRQELYDVHRQIKALQDRVPTSLLMNGDRSQCGPSAHHGSGRLGSTRARWVSASG